MVRLLISLESNQSVDYNSNYNKMKGSVYEGLDNSPFSELHDVKDIPKFCFSNIFPYEDVIEENSEKNWMVCSPHEGLIDFLHKYYSSKDDLNIGEMSFNINDVSFLNPDVGSTGTRGVLETGTGMYIRIPEEKFDEYGVDVDYNAEVLSWEPDFSLEVFKNRFMDNLKWKFESIYPDYITDSEYPESFDDLFESVDMIDSYGVKTLVSEDQNYQKTFILSKWRFNYEVKSEVQRRLLNTLLYCGSGWQNSLGFGFMNITEKNGERI